MEVKNLPFTQKNAQNSVNVRALFQEIVQRYSSFKTFFLFCTVDALNKCTPFSALAGEDVPVEEQFDKEKAKAEVLALDKALNNDKTAPTPALSTLPGVTLTGPEKEKCEAEMAKLYKEMDDKVDYPRYLTYY